MRGVVTLMLRNSVTAPAKRYQVLQVVGLAWLIEAGKRYDMMNVKRASIFGFSHAAMLTSVIVPLSRPCALSTPILAIPPDSAAVPMGIAICLHVLALAFVLALLRAVISFRHFRWLTLKCFATNVAEDGNALSPTQTRRRGHTLQTTIRPRGLLTRIIFKRLVAEFAFFSHKFHMAILA